MSGVSDAWEDEWAAVADQPHDQAVEQDSTQKKPSTKISKAQKRAQQAEFNRQFWAEAEGPKQPNYFLESRNVVPLRQEFKPAPILLSRKGPIHQQKPKSSSPQLPTDSLNNLSIASRHGGNNQDSSGDEEEETEETRKKAYQERQQQAARERELKQRKYEERRLELFGPPAQNTNQNANGDMSNLGGTKGYTKSGNTTPASNTPPHSRSSTPNSRGRRGRGGRGGGGGGGGGGAQGNFSQIQTQPKIYQQQPQVQLQQHHQQLKELYDPQYSMKPESLMLLRHQHNQTQSPDIQPVRAPRGPDGSGRGGFGFANRSARNAGETDINDPLQLT